jgi:hypothetical protein
MRWDYRDPLLLWLFLPAFSLHVLEEYLVGFPAWFRLISGQPLPLPGFVAINSLGATLLLTAIVATTRHQRLAWIAVSIATVAVMNPLAHLLASILTGTYSPGLVTGVVLLLPPGQLVLLRAWYQAERLMLRRGVLVGLVAQACVTATALILSTF